MIALRFLASAETEHLAVGQSLLLHLHWNVRAPYLDRLVWLYLLLQALNGCWRFSGLLGTFCRPHADQVILRWIWPHHNLRILRFHHRASFLPNERRLVTWASREWAEIWKRSHTELARNATRHALRSCCCLVDLHQSLYPALGVDMIISWSFPKQVVCARIFSKLSVDIERRRFWDVGRFVRPEVPVVEEQD